MEVRTGMGPGRQPNVIFAVLMIAAGIILFLANLGLFPIHRVWDYWPLVLTAIGFGRLAGARKPGKILVGVSLVVLGIMATLFNTGVFPLRLHDESWLLSLLFIVLGISGLARVLDGEPWDFTSRDFHSRLQSRIDRKMARRQRRMGLPEETGEPVFQFNYSSDSDPVLNNYVMMGHIKRKVESQNFQGGKLTSILGSIEIDLRRAHMPDGQKTAELELNATLGHIALRVPDSWRVIWSGENVLGNFEDKTIPPNTGADAPQLVLVGGCNMGAIEVEN